MFCVAPAMIVVTMVEEPFPVNASVFRDANNNPAL